MRRIESQREQWALLRFADSEVPGYTSPAARMLQQRLRDQRGNRRIEDVAIVGVDDPDALQDPFDPRIIGASRRRAVPENPSRRYLDKLMEHIEENGWGGMTVKNVPGDAPGSGYMVSIKGTEKKIPLDELSGKSLAEFLAQHHDLINAHPDHYMGGWKAGRDWYNDVSRIHDQDKGLFPAAKDAFQNDQLALYDLKNDREIGTDEAGWMTGAPWIVGHRHDY